jgi:hypothetical protein
MTSLISSSGIGPLRELVRLRQKQELVLEQKDLEIEAMRTENAGLNDQVYRLEGELYKAKLENQSTHASLKPTSDCDIAALISANKTLKIKIKNQTAHLKGLSEKCAQLKSAAKEEKEINITREQQVLKPAPISRLIEPASRQPIHESVKVTVAPPTDPTPTTDTTELQSPKIWIEKCSDTASGRDGEESQEEGEGSRESCGISGTGSQEIRSTQRTGFGGCRTPGQIDTPYWAETRGRRQNP